MGLERLSNWTTAAVKTLRTPKVEPAELGVSENVQHSQASSYYVDTLSKAGEELPQIENTTAGKNFVYPKSKLEIRLDQSSSSINSELEKEEKDFEKLLPLIHSVIMCMMRLAAKSDQENIHEISLKIKDQAQKIKATYNTWQGLTITVVSSGVSFVGAGAGLSPLLPLSVISAGTAQALQTASQPIGTASTGFSGIGSIFNNRSEGERQVYQVHLKRIQDTEEERKGSKQSKGQLTNSALSTWRQWDQANYEARRGILNG